MNKDGYKILLVENESLIAMALEKNLQAIGHEVVASVCTGLEAIACLENAKPDLALLDIVLPGDIDGIRIAEIIRDRFGVPFIYISAHTDKITLERAKLTEPLGFIAKPFKPADLLTTISLAMYKYEMEKNRREKGSGPTAMHAPLKKIGLTEKEIEVCILLKEGSGTEEIARHLSITVATARTHLRNIHAKLGVHTNAQLVTLISNLERP